MGQDLCPPMHKATNVAVLGTGEGTMTIGTAAAVGRVGGAGMMRIATGAGNAGAGAMTTGAVLGLAAVTSTRTAISSSDGGASATDHVR